MRPTAEKKQRRRARRILNKDQIQTGAEETKVKTGTDKATFTQFDKNNREVIAFRESLANHIVGILTDEGTGVGTGNLIRYGGRRVILTAHHVIKGNDASNLRFAFRPEGSLEEAPLKRFGKTSTPLLSGERIKVSRVLIDIKNDLAALVLARGQKVRGPARFYDATDLKNFELHDGTSLVFLGFPSANAINVAPNKKAVGAVTDHVPYESALNKRKSLDLGPHQFAIPYWWKGELPPHGLSGAAIWCFRDSSSAIWIPDPVPVGVIVNYGKTSHVLIAADLSCMLKLLSGR
jgi:hypothetical protein